MCNFRKKQEKNIILCHIVPRINPQLKTISVSAILRLRDQLLIALWQGFCLLNEVLCSGLCFNTDTSFKNIQGILHIMRKKGWRFGKIFFAFRRWQLKHIRECKTGKFFFHFSNETLKSSISFILKHILMYLTHFIQVA